MSLQLHRPDGRGGLEKGPPEGDWRAELSTRRWGSGLRRRRLPGMANPEMNPTPVAMSVLFWAGLAILTLVLLVAGYGTGFWH